MSDDAPGHENSHAPSSPLRSEVGWSTPDRIVVRGFDLVDDLLGVVLLQCFEQRDEPVLAAMRGQQLA
jgi:hypothetical protein